MEYKHLGRSGLKVSRLALGTMNFGWVADEAAGFSIMDEALEVDLSADALRRLDEIWPGPAAKRPRSTPGDPDKEPRQARDQRTTEVYEHLFGPLDTSSRTGTRRHPG